MMVAVAEQAVDHGQPFEIMAQAIVVCHGDGAVKLDRFLTDQPAGLGDLLNFKLESSGNAPLSLEYVVESEDGLKRTYYTDENSEEVYFGNSIGFQVL